MYINKELASQYGEKDIYMMAKGKGFETECLGCESRLEITEGFKLHKGE